MKIQIKKQVGKSLLQFEVDEPKGRDALFNAGFLASTPDECSLCHSKDVCLEGNKAKGYTFVKVACKKCGAKADMGEYKDGGFYWKQFSIQHGQAQEKADDIPVLEDEEVNVENIPF